MHVHIDYTCHQDKTSNQVQIKVPEFSSSSASGSVLARTSGEIIECSAKQHKKIQKESHPDSHVPCLPQELNMNMKIDEQIKIPANV
jgi:hypothetical protein